MRLVSYRDPRGERVGAVVRVTDGGRLLDLGSGPLEFMLADDRELELARAAVAGATLDTLPRLGDAALLPPVRPHKILCLGYNYRGHVPDGADPIASDPRYPDVFVKTANVLTGPNDPVPLPAASTDVDYEGEIAIVIGRRARDVPLDRAGEHIAGYTLFNDVSARDWQRRSNQLSLGKCFDSFGPLGPAVVTPDEIPDPQALVVEVVRDGVVTVSQSTATMIFPMAFLVHYLSHVMTLEPGDIIATGTPQKLPEALAAHRPLADGDAVTIRVAGIGELTTTFADAPKVQS